MSRVDQIKKILNEVSESIEEMPEGEQKTKAFELILRHLLVSSLANTKEQDNPNLDRVVVKKTKRKPAGTSSEQGTNVDHTKIIGEIKTCDEANKIETNILSRNSQVDRTLLPIYIVHEKLDNAYGLTSGDINKISTDLGIPISTANASRTLSGIASKYVIGDKLRKKGGIVRYKLHKRGVEYMQTVIAGVSNEDKK